MRIINTEFITVHVLGPDGDPETAHEISINTRRIVSISDGGIILDTAGEVTKLKTVETREQLLAAMRMTPEGGVPFNGRDRIETR